MSDIDTLTAVEETATPQTEAIDETAAPIETTEGGNLEESSEQTLYVCWEVQSHAGIVYAYVNAATEERVLELIQTKTPDIDLAKLTVVGKSATPGLDGIDIVDDPPAIFTPEPAEKLYQCFEVTYPYPTDHDPDGTDVVTIHTDSEERAQELFLEEHPRFAEGGECAFQHTIALVDPLSDLRHFHCVDPRLQEFIPTPDVFGTPVGFEMTIPNPPDRWQPTTSFDMQTIHTPLSAERAAEIGDRLANAYREMEGVKDEKKKADKDFTEQINTLADECSTLSRSMKMNREEVTVKVQHFYDPVNGRIQLRRVDTGEVVGERGMTYSERQLQMDLDSDRHPDDKEGLPDLAEKLEPSGDDVADEIANQLQPDIQEWEGKCNGCGWIWPSAEEPKACPNCPSPAFSSQFVKRFSNWEVRIPNHAGDNDDDHYVVHTFDSRRAWDLVIAEHPELNGLEFQEGYITSGKPVDSIEALDIIDYETIESINRALEVDLDAEEPAQTQDEYAGWMMEYSDDAKKRTCTYVRCQTKERALELFFESDRCPERLRADHRKLKVVSHCSLFLLEDFHIVDPDFVEQVVDQEARS